MHAVILAAGDGSRMGFHTADKPKSFIEVDSRTLYERQREVLEDHVDGVTVMLGYAYENVIDAVGDDALVVDGWERYENAESLRLALERVADDVLVLNGDIIVSEVAVERLCRRHDALDGYCLVGCLPGLQDEHTAIRYDADGVVTDYGMIRGHRHAGIGIVDRSHRRAAIEWLGRHRTEWYPGFYPRVPTKRVRIPAREHIEINRPADLALARRRLPFESAETADVEARR